VNYKESCHVNSVSLWKALPYISLLQFKKLCNGFLYLKKLVALQSKTLIDALPK
jgi:hypothetical protein